ncbi:phosphoribosylglycinamide formyltransferase [Oharaeibacter diazotrophicus]|uniref:Phosphoribosylglycinamide formyltransferase n=1 Tax=Oharaeibacter diazotrophicus TaxID=1920512 RepID=A0A4R6RLN5_9HYPH|nr:phosphoribosylglycinamide formyltransferase [Oharaeibacter diazotrophicus]TDP87412.1 phosphoribosylglycinamide formyltransferase-1 [Oharaeibacter diazotrophicus]BBE70644.1 phosphoribosylglycinamide formyltransferase [Pleomorphomonas sp. SM30]GLS77390.1 phosphoribosylglycinamide formyltransferase [Oharaeibacter diazotrophicus]
MSQDKCPVGVLISGRGSNMAALVEAAEAPGYPARIAVVIANKADAAGLDFARARGIPAIAVPHRDFADKAAFETAMTAELERHGVELVCLAGFMRLLSPVFIERWRDRLINIHPSLLPAYRGLHTHERALADGVRVAGCTVHFVVPEVDAGPIVAQAAVPVMPGDDADALSARVLAAEHRLYPHALALVASGAARVEGGAVVLTGVGAAPAPLIVPPIPS